MEASSPASTLVDPGEVDSLMRHSFSFIGSTEVGTWGGADSLTRGKDGMTSGRARFAAADFGSGASDLEDGFGAISLSWIEMDETSITDPDSLLNDPEKIS